MDDWKTPDFLQSMKPKKTKRLSPCSETEIWEKDKFLSIIKYEPYKRNKTALALMWDLNARNHITEDKKYTTKRKVWRRRNLLNSVPFFC
jgi:hypothetical protein